MRPPMSMNPTGHPMLSQVARNDPQVANALQVCLIRLLDHCHRPILITDDFYSD